MMPRLRCSACGSRDLEIEGTVEVLRVQCNECGHYWEEDEDGYTYGPDPRYSGLSGGGFKKNNLPGAE